MGEKQKPTGSAGMRQAFYKMYPCPEDPKQWEVQLVRLDGAEQREEPGIVVSLGKKTACQRLVRKLNLQMRRGQRAHQEDVARERAMSQRMQNETKKGEDFFSQIYAKPERLKQFLCAMTGISMGVAKALASQFLGLITKVLWTSGVLKAAYRSRSGGSFSPHRRQL